MVFKGITIDGSGSLWSDADDRLARDMWAQGYSARDIGDKLGRTRGAVLGYINRNDINRVSRVKPTISRPRAPRASYIEQVPEIRVPPLPSPKREPRAYDGARPWLERASFECAFPVSGDGADVYSCCKPTDAIQGYCAYHRKRMFSRPTHTVRAPRGA